jgi:hypothetical protein
MVSQSRPLQDFHDYRVTPACKIWSFEVTPEAATAQMVLLVDA